ncbi:MAG TPA: alkaline phosphatase family protein [Solirubrobacterales bacterium]|nr:alkaline phosphatase family protein [Solirubrobacterales bacterium]
MSATTDFAAPASEIKHPLEELDRWLLGQLAELGAMRADEFAANRSVQTAGGEPALSDAEVKAWLRSAARGGLIEPLTVDLSGRRLRPPSWRIGDAGRTRLKEATPFAARLPLAPLRRLAARARRLLPGAPPEWTEVVEAIHQADVAWDERPLPPDTSRRKIQATVEAADEATELLRQRVGRIVVLMLENRSFDHMLGYLRLQGNEEVDGLTGGSEQSNVWEGKTYTPRRLDSTRFPKSQDPGHSIDNVSDQLENENGGFVSNFATIDPDHPDLVMGYYDGSRLPVYDFLAHNACICDRWYSSVPGSTWVNRLYAMCGRADREREGIPDGPLWDFTSFPQHLDEAGVMWRWYSHDPATLRVADAKYRNPLDSLQQHFRYFDRKMVSDVTRVAESWIVDEHSSFLDNARNGELPPVSWIDPNFIDLSFLERNSNDDHPPSDVRAAQELVLTVVRALAEGPAEQLRETLLIVTYDEHGGFYDHVPPPPAPHDPDFPRYGVRVPAFVFSPWVEPGSVSHTLFDHTSIIRTILERFAPDGVEKMGPRVAKAEHLGRLLTRAEPAPVGDYGAAISTIAEWRANGAANAVAATPVPTVAEKAAPPALEGFPAEMVRASRVLRDEHKLPAAQP